MLIATLWPGVYLRLEGPGGDGAHVYPGDVPPMAGRLVPICSRDGVEAARLDRNRHPEVRARGQVSVGLEVAEGWMVWNSDGPLPRRRGIRTA